MPAQMIVLHILESYWYSKHCGTLWPNPLILLAWHIYTYTHMCIYIYYINIYIHTYIYMVLAGRLDAALGHVRLLLEVQLGRGVRP
jgi:hypothetical protein